jgi:glycosyltransferase involved in cell wall biosynthesis
MKTFLAATHTARSNTQTGIQTVTRGLVAGGGFTPVAWFDHGAHFHTLKPEWACNVGAVQAPPKFTLRALPAWLRAMGRAHRVPLDKLPLFREPHTGWMIMPELMDAEIMEGMFAWSRRHGLRNAVLFHDAIPWLRPDLTERDGERHARYMASLADADLVIAVSHFSEKCLRDFWNERGLTGPRLTACLLPAEIPGQPRVCGIKPRSDVPARILCTSTLEPRKNHRALIEAFTLANPDAELHLAGGKFEAAPEIADFVADAVQRDPRIRWHGSMARDEVCRLYDACDFTIYPSFLEGFGLPVMESLWFARPCICASFGVMAENAADGGCLTVDVNDTAQLADAITRLTRDISLREKLAHEAVSRSLRTWRDYSREIRREFR